MPTNEKLRGPLAKNSDQGTSLPFVFLVGNHSSGKSSFINYILGRKVQTAGVAPTDDTFTVIAPGPKDMDQDGPALIGDPDMGFANLRQFGPTLIHHTQLKVRTDVNNSDFMLVDSPGMIDSPAAAAAATATAGSSAGNSIDRGYDFPGVVRWFANRADVVLLFFDPDKPGTTGETLSVLLHSLGGMDHKLLIVLNKADQFRKIHDFARAYGSLCWNLSKVIPRKDLPRIYTMCLPVDGSGNGKQQQQQHPDASSSSSKSRSRSSGLSDLYQTRDEVVAEVMKAPKRRIDNVITSLGDSVNLLLMHAVILEHTSKKYNSMVWSNRLQLCAVSSAGLTITGTSIYTGLPMQISGCAAALTVLGAGVMHWFNATKLSELEADLISSEGLSKAFQQTHAREISEADEFVVSVWQRINDPLHMSLEALGLENVPITDIASDVKDMRTILDEEIPRLRRLASADHFGNRI